MACDLANIAMAKLLSSEKLVAKISQIKNYSDNLTVQLAGETNPKRMLILQENIKKLQATQEATILGAFVESGFSVNANIGADIVNKLRDTGFHSRSIVDLLEALFDIRTNKTINETIKLAGEGYDISTVEAAVINKIASDEYYRTLFDNFEYDKIDNKAYSDIKDMVGDDNNALSYYITYTQLFYPDNIFNADGVLKGLKFSAEKGFKGLDSETIVANINATKTASDLEMIAKYNLISMKGDIAVINAFSDKLLELTTKAKDKETLGMIANSNEILSEIKSLRALKSDPTFFGRLNQILGVSFTNMPAKEVKQKLYDLIKGEVKEITLGKKGKDDIVLTEKDKLQALTILGPIEIMNFSMKTRRPLDLFANDIVKGLEIKDDTAKAQIILSILKTGDEDRLAKYIKEAISTKERVPTDASGIIIGKVIPNNVDASKPGVIFDVNGYASKLSISNEAKQSFAIHEDLYNQNAYKSTKQVDYADDISSLEKILDTGNVKYVYLTDMRGAQFTDMVDMITSKVYKDAEGKETPVMIVNQSAGLSNFSVGYFQDGDKYFLTARANNAPRGKEILDSLFYIDQPIEKLQYIASDSSLAKVSTIQDEANSKLLEGITVEEGMQSGTSIIKIPGPKDSTPGQTSFSMEDGIPKIDVVAAPMKDGEVVKGNKTLEKAVRWFESQGYKTFKTTVQGRSGSEAINSLIKKGIISFDSNTKVYTIVRETEAGSNIQLAPRDAKVLSLSYLYTKQQDFGVAQASVQAMSLEDIINTVSNEFQKIGYDIGKVSIAGMDENAIKEAFFDFMYTGTTDPNINVLDIAIQKNKAMNELKALIGINDSGRSVNHYATLAMMKTLEDAGFSIPTNGAREMLQDIINTGRISDNADYMTTFLTTNKKAIEESGIGVRGVLNSALEKAKIYLQHTGTGSYKSKTPKSGIGVIVTNTPSDEILSIRANLENAPTFTGPIDFDGISSRYNNLLDTYYNKKLQAINNGETINDIKVIDELFYQQLDEFEFIELENTIGRLFSGPDKSRIIYGRKFNKLPSYTKDDIPMLDNVISSMKKEFNDTINLSKQTLEDGTKQNSLEINGYEIKKDIDGNPSVITIDDVIKLEEGKIMDGTPTSVIKKSDDELSTMSMQDKVAYKETLKQANQQDLQSLGYIRNILESTSLRLREQKFFDNYKLVPTIHGLLPEAVAKVDNTMMPENVGMLIKKQVFDAINTRFRTVDPKTLLDFEANKKFIEDTINDVLSKSTDLQSLRMDGQVLSNDATYAQVAGDFAIELSNDFDVYAYIKPVKKDAVEHIRKVYQMDEGITRNEREPYFRTDGDLDSQFLQLSDTEDLVSKDVQYHNNKAEEFYRKKVEREQEGAERLMDNYNEYLSTFNGFVIRDVARKYSSMEVMYKASEAIASSGVKAGETLKALYRSPLSVAVDLQAVSQLNLPGSSWAAGKLVTKDSIAKLEQAKSLVEDLMSLNDEDFAIKFKSGFKEGIGGALALDIAKYFRDLRSALGTDGLGRGPSRSRQVNIAMHDMYKSFQSVGGAGKDNKEILNDLISYQSQLTSRAVLGTMNYEDVVKIAGDEWSNSTLGAGKDKDTIQLLGEDRLIKTVSDIKLKESLESFRTLFGENFTQDDYVVIMQGIIGFNNVIGLQTGISKGTQILKSIPLAPLLGRSMQLGFKILTGATQIIGYESLKGGLAKMYPSSEIKEAGKLKRTFGFGTELFEFRIAKDIQSDGLENYLKRTAIREDGIRAAINDISDTVAYDQLQRGEHIGYINSILGTLKNLYSSTLDVMSSGGFGRTVEFWFSNANNLFDFAYIGPIQDYAFYQAIRKNGFKDFDSVDEFKKFVNNGNPELVTKVVNNIKATAQRLYGDISGNNRSSHGRMVNPFLGTDNTGKRFATGAVFAFQEINSYLNGRGRNRALSLGRVIQQTASLLYKNGGILSKTGREDAIKFIMNTPEYRAQMAILINDIRNAVLYSRITNDDDELTPEDIINGIKTVSQSYQALSIVGEFRPIIGAAEETISESTNINPLEAFGIAFTNTLLSNLTVPTKVIELYGDLIGLLGKGDIDRGEEFGSILNKYLLNASAGSFDYIFGKAESSGRLQLSGASDFGLALITGDTDNFLTAIGQQTAGLINLRKGFGISNWRVDSPIRKVNMFLNAGLGIGKRIYEGIHSGKEISALTVTQSEQLVGDLQESIQNTSTFKELQIAGNIVIPSGATAEAKSFWYNYIFKNPFIGSTADFSKVKDLRENEKLGDTDFDSGTKYLFDHIGKDGLREMQVKYAKYEDMLGRAKDLSNEEKNDLLSFLMPEDSMAVEIALRSKESIGFKDDMLRRVINNDLFKAMEEFKGEGAYQVLGAMRTGAELYGQRDLGSKQNEKENEIKLYNSLAPIFAEIYPQQTDKYQTDIIGIRHAREINESMGWDIYEKDESGDFWKLNYKGGNALKQLLSINEAVREGNYSLALAELSPIGQGVVSFGDKGKVDTMYGLTRMMTMLDNANLSDNEKAHLKYVVLKNSSITTDPKFVEDLGEDGKTIVDDYFNAMYKAEDDISVLSVNGVLSELERNFKSNDPMGELQKKITEENTKKLGKTSGVSAKKAGKSTFSKLEAREFMKDFGKKLDSKRLEYKTRKASAPSTQNTDGLYQRILKAKYPMNISAQTKAPSGLTKKQLTEKKDITRNIKKPKRAKLLPPLI